MSNKKDIPSESKFWKRFQSLHIYDTKAEALFKSFIITISWIGGVHLPETPAKITKEIGATFYLFALALIMEYLLKLITSNKFMPKILPFSLIFLNIITVLCTSAIFFDKPFPKIEYEHLFWLEIISLGIIWVDVITMLLIEPSPKEHIENNLKYIKNGDSND